MEEKGKILILSAPSGTGKTTIAKRIMSTDPDFVNSISFTTREPREGEKDGVDYFFRSEEDFKKMIENKEFLECAEVFGHYYGSTNNFVERKVEENKIVLFDIDWQGAQIIRKRARVDVLSVFIMPPTMEELRNRLESRGKDSQEEIEKRLSKAESEIAHKDEYDAVIINHDVDVAVAEIISLAKNRL